VFVPEKYKQTLVDNLLREIKRQYGVEKGNSTTEKFNPDVACLINDLSVERIKQNLQTCGGELIIGGLQSLDAGKKYLSPTLIVNPIPDSSLAREEIFGPVLYIVTYTEFDEVINQI
jgi:acyl-CoA reductase-like NAD-dependent aldehyde dehydrogenase